MPAGENPGLWLLDIIRRAACGKPQAEGTGFLPARKAARQAEPQSAARPAPKHRLRRVLGVLLVLVLLAALFAAGMWWYLGGDMNTLPKPGAVLM